MSLHWCNKSSIVGTHGWKCFVPLSITCGWSCKHQLGWMIIIKDDLIGNSWGSMSIFVKSERSFQHTFISLFKIATMNHLVCKQFEKWFWNKSHIFYGCRLCDVTLYMLSVHFCINIKRILCAFKQTKARPKKLDKTNDGWANEV